MCDQVEPRNADSCALENVIQAARAWLNNCIVILLNAFPRIVAALFESEQSVVIRAVVESIKAGQLLPFVSALFTVDNTANAVARSVRRRIGEF